MTSNAARSNRLRSLFNAIVHGQRDVGSNGPLFIEAIAAQQDPLLCITTIMSQPQGLPSISTAMASVTSLSHLNGVASDFLLFLRHRDVKNTNSGQFLPAFNLFARLVQRSLPFRELVKVWRFPIRMSEFLARERRTLSRSGENMKPISLPGLLLQREATTILLSSPW